MSEFAWLDDFNEYSKNFLKVKSKSGQIVPFAMNVAQQYIHTCLEKQRAETGMVRAVILKGRQQGCCYSPEMRVITADYQWKKIGDISVGEKLLATDEHTGVKESISGRKTERRIRTATVEAKVEFLHEAFEIVLSNNTTLIVTGEHRHLCRKRGGDNAEWREVSKTKVGDVLRAACHAPDDRARSFDNGWFGGLLDGEGSFGASPQVRISLSQVNGCVLERSKDYLRLNAVNYYELIDERKAGLSSKLGNKPVHCLRIDRLTDVLKLLTRTRPTRFVNRELLIGKKLPKTCPGFEAWVKVESIKSIGLQRVVDIQTSEKTFICEGIVSHNSTYIEGRFFQRTVTNFGLKTFILTHEQTATDNLFGMTQRYLEHYPDRLKPALGSSNAKELVFSQLDSSFSVATAGNRGAGRSATAQLLHGSEAAYWSAAEDHLAGIMQTVPMEAGTEIIFESTANGIGNVFHQLWQKGEEGVGGWISIFVPWFWQLEYRCDGVLLADDDLEYGAVHGLDTQQMMWRRYKIDELGGDIKLFNREYPSSPAEAFSVSDEKSLIDSKRVQSSRKLTAMIDNSAPKIIGVDPARFGDDSTAIYLRQGRVAERLEKVRGIDTMSVVGVVVKFIAKYSPDAVFIDEGGIGGGIVDRLKELNYRNIVHGVNFGSDALDKDRYVNKRSEMWCLMNEWLDGRTSQIPDDNVLEVDLCGLRYSYDSKGRKKLESKDDARKRGIKSPDDGDALALTWAMPVRKHQINERKFQTFRGTVKGFG